MRHTPTTQQLLARRQMAEYYRTQYEGPECVHVGDAEDEIDFVCCWSTSFSRKYMTLKGV